VICHTPQGIEAQGDFLAAKRRIGAADVALRRSDNARVGSEGSFDDERSVGEERHRIGRQRALAHMVEGDRFGHRQERHAGACDSLLEVEVFVRSQAYIEATLRDDQGAVEDCAMNHQGAVAGERLERCGGNLGSELDRAKPACRADDARAAIRDLRTGDGFEFGEHLGNESRLDGVVGVEEEKPAAGRCRDASVARHRHACRRAVLDHQRETRIAGEVGLGHSSRAVGRSVVDDDGLPVRASLGQ
jgi:hypothetical protein